MAARADLSHPFVMLQGKYGRKNIAFSIDGEDPESPIGMNLIKVGKPPLNLSVIQPYASTARLLDSSELQDFAPGPQSFISSLDENSGFLPIFRSGSCSEIGPKPYMKDEHICIDNLVDYLKEGDNFPTGAFYGVFDGHGGMDAASFVCSNLLEFIFADQHFPISVEEAVKSAFVKADYAFADLQSVDCSSGTTALTALIFGRTMLIANAGDCRAVLGKRGRAIELSRDHKPNCNIERIRIEKLGGSVFDGYLNGQLSVSRALGDWHMKGPKGSACPLIAEPELLQTTLTEEDEFLIMGCDGLWDVMSSQCAVNMVRKELMVHNDPEKCSRALVREALQRNTCDNLTVVVVCFSPNRPPPPPRVDISRSQFRRSISLEGLHLLQGVLDRNT